MQANYDKAREEFVSEGAKILKTLVVEVERRRPSYLRKTVIIIQSIVSNRNSKV